MAFIPNPKYIGVGDRVRLTKEVTIPAGTFTAGHEFEVTLITRYQSSKCYYDLVDDDGLIIRNVRGWNIEKIS